MKQSVLSNLKEGTYYFIKAIFSTILLFIVIRIIEFVYITVKIDPSINLNLLFSRSINFDSLFIIILSAYLFLPNLLLSLINRRIAKIFVQVSVLIAVVSNIALTQYFLTNHSLLTSVILEFSISDIIDIIINEFVLDKMAFWIFWLLILSLTIYVISTLIDKIPSSKKWNVALFIVYTIFVVIGLGNRSYVLKSLDHFESNYHFLYGNSKHIFLIKSYQNKVSLEGVEINELEKFISRFQSMRDEFEYTNSEFPLIHNESTHNVLGNYFEKTNVTPNIVFIISESLSSSFSGNVLGLNKSITPFTDSLANQGLYWTRFFSNAERSYGVLPNIFSSLPSGIGERGFINMDIEYASMRYYPHHSNLIEILKNNGYETSYFYGGWGGFDNTERYMKEIGIDNFISDVDFNTKKYTKRKGSWGYNDKDLFSQSIEMMERREGEKPLLNIYQTISLHTPFNLSESKYYSDSYLTKKLNELEITKKEVSKIRKKTLSSIFFADDALRKFIVAFSKQPNYENTIFIITGDHAIDLNLSKHNFENFHVPLIIYSPSLLKSATFNGACSHLDILPSIIALLEDNYGLEIDNNERHWIGQGLDTSSSFQFERMIPLKLESLELPNFIYNDNVIYGGSVFKINSDLSLSNETDTSKIEDIESIYTYFKYINTYVCKNDKIWRE